jgi:hypothetical protein
MNPRVEIPPDARCARCGFSFRQHEVGHVAYASTCEQFVPTKFCGGSLTERGEREAYDRAMRGE